MSSYLARLVSLNDTAVDFVDPSSCVQKRGVWVQTVGTHSSMKTYLFTGFEKSATVFDMTRKVHSSTKILAGMFCGAVVALGSVTVR